MFFVYVTVLRAPCFLCALCASALHAERNIIGHRYVHRQCCAKTRCGIVLPQPPKPGYKFMNVMQECEHSCKCKLFPKDKSRISHLIFNFFSHLISGYFDLEAEHHVICSSGKKINKKYDPSPDSQFLSSHLKSTFFFPDSCRPDFADRI